MNQTKIWEHFQNDSRAAEVAFGGRPRYEFLARRCKRGSRILNVGVGRGGFEELLVSTGANISCLDPSEKSIEMLRHRLGLGDKAKVGFSQSMPFPSASFDVVVMSEVLEHLDDEALLATLGEVRRVLVPGGIFIGTVPADENLLENQAVCPKCGELFHRWGHVQSFSEQQLRGVLAQKFPTVAISRQYFSDPARLNWKGRLSRFAKLAAMSVGVYGKDESFSFEAIAR